MNWTLAEVFQGGVTTRFLLVAMLALGTVSCDVEAHDPPRATAAQLESQDAEDIARLRSGKVGLIGWTIHPGIDHTAIRVKDWSAWKP